LGCWLFPLKTLSPAFGIILKAPCFISFLISHKIYYWFIALKTDHICLWQDVETHVLQVPQLSHIWHQCDEIVTDANETCTDMSLLQSSLMAPFSCTIKSFWEHHDHTMYITTNENCSEKYLG
jgi:hypothetical protein